MVRTFLGRRINMSPNYVIHGHPRPEYLIMPSVTYFGKDLTPLLTSFSHTACIKLVGREKCVAEDTCEDAGVGAKTKGQDMQHA